MKWKFWRNSSKATLAIWRNFMLYFVIWYINITGNYIYALIWLKRIEIISQYFVIKSWRHIYLEELEYSYVYLGVTNKLFFTLIKHILKNKLSFMWEYNIHSTLVFICLTNLSNIYSLHSLNTRVDVRE